MKQLSAALFFLLCLLIGSSCFYENKEDLFSDQMVEDTSTVTCEVMAISFANDILPILSPQCNDGCHNANDRLGNIILETHSNVLFHVNDGSLLGSINHLNDFEPMPPFGQKIPSCDIKKIQAWVDDGAPNN